MFPLLDLIDADGGTAAPGTGCNAHESCQAGRCKEFHTHILSCRFHVHVYGCSAVRLFSRTRRRLDLFALVVIFGMR